VSVSLTQDQIRAVRVLTVGDVMLDRYWFGDAHRISPEAPVPIVRVERVDDRLGGAANVAKNVAALGARAGLLSVVGTDEPGRAIEALLTEAAIDSHLHRDSTLPTTIKLRVIGRQQQLIRIDFEDQPNQEVLRDKYEQFNALLAAYDIVIMSDYGKGGLTHIRRMIEAAIAAGRRVLVDPKGDEYERYRGATLLTPNRSELRDVIGRWTNEKQLEEKVAELRHSLSIEALLLTRSEEGMTLFSDGGRIDVEAEAREVFDVTGAGDTVIAALAVMLGAGLSLQDAVGEANRAAGIVVGKLGTSTASYQEMFGSERKAAP
jgi:D-glycero-beta-D-manno-heptose-7-phosphate kinase